MTSAESKLQESVGIVCEHCGGYIGTACKGCPVQEIIIEIRRNHG